MKHSPRRDLPVVAAVAVCAAAAALTIGTAVPAAAAVTALSDCRFGPAQVFDTQYVLDPVGLQLSVSQLDVPYGNNVVAAFPGSSSPQLTAPGALEASDYFQFVENGSAIELRLYDSAGVEKGVVDTDGDFYALGDDFLFYRGGGFYGTLITTSAGFDYGDSTVLQVTNTAPSAAEALGYTSCSATPIAAPAPTPAPSATPSPSPSADPDPDDTLADTGIDPALGLGLAGAALLTGLALLPLRRKPRTRQR